MLSKLVREKRGDATDIIFFLIIIFFLAVSFVVVIFVNTKVQSVISDTALNESAAYESINEGFNNINQTVTQRGFVLMFALFIVGLMISGFLVRVHPVFIFIYIFTMVMSVITAVYLSNTYQALIENQQLALLADNYPMITYIMQHSVTIIIAVGILSMIVTFAKLASPSTQFGGDL